MTTVGKATIADVSRFRDAGAHVPLERFECSREFDLAVACCRWPPSDARNEAIRAAARSDIDWGRFYRVISRQRIWALAHDGIRRAEVAAPAEVTQALAAAADRFGRLSANYLEQTIRLRDLFDQAGLDVTFFKGASLGVLAYGDGALKHARDIDLLIAPDAIHAGLALLRSNGYLPRHPLPDSPALFAAWLRTAKDFELFHPQHNTTVELHWALVDNMRHAAALAANLRTREVDLGGGRNLLTFEHDILIVYLCAHGARHGWFRLKWIADLAALLSQASPAEFEACVALAQSCDMEPCVAQAVLLCDQLFRLDLVADAAAAFRQNPRYRWLERVALNAMTSGGGEIEPLDIPNATVPTLFSRFFLGNRWSYRLAELRLRLVSLKDMQALALPRPLWFLYPLVRLPLSLARHIRGGDRHADLDGGADHPRSAFDAPG